MNIKEMLLKMPAWKAGILALLLMMGAGVVVEEIVIHTFLHVFNRVMNIMESDQKDDMDDIDEMDKSRQRSLCFDYSILVDEKAKFAAKNAKEIQASDFNYTTMLSHESDIQLAIQNHKFNLEECKKALREKKS
jgi:hypothetical protein